jgi:hypothetical protein
MTADGTSRTAASTAFELLDPELLEFRWGRVAASVGRKRRPVRTLDFEIVWEIDLEGNGVPVTRSLSTGTRALSAASRSVDAL